MLTFVSVWDVQVHDWLRDDVEFGEGGDEDGEEGEEGDADGPSEASSGAKPIVKAPTKKPGANRPQGGAGAGAAEVADGGATLGQSIKNMAVRMFRSRAPKPKSINVMLYQAKGVRWSAADHHCRKMHKMICPMKVSVLPRACLRADTARLFVNAELSMSSCLFSCSPHFLERQASDG